MATNPTPKKQSTPSPLPQLYEEEEEDELHSDESGEEDSSDEGDDSSETEPKIPTHNPTPSDTAAAAAATCTVPGLAPTAASDDSSYEGDDDSGEEDSSESEPEKPTPNPLHSTAAAAANCNIPIPGFTLAPAAALDDSSDEGDDSDEDFESEPEPPTSNPSHFATATCAVPAPTLTSDDDDNEREESEEDDMETEKEQPSNQNFVQKFAEKDVATPSKKTTGKGEASRKSFQRIWSDKDQIILLKEMVDYMDTQGGNDLMANIESFWSIIRKKLSFPVTKLQLMGKIRKVKEKYRNNRKKNRVFAKSYDAKVFEWSKKLWEESMARENGRGKKRKSDVLDEVLDVDCLEWEDETVNLSMKNIGWTEEIVRTKIMLLSDSDRKLMVQNWKKLKKEQLTCFVNRISLRAETIATIFW